MGRAILPPSDGGPWSLPRIPPCSPGPPGSRHVPGTGGGWGIAGVPKLHPCLGRERGGAGTLGLLLWKQSWLRSGGPGPAAQTSRALRGTACLPVAPRLCPARSVSRLSTVCRPMTTHSLPFLSSLVPGSLQNKGQGGTRCRRAGFLSHLCRPLWHTFLC